MGNISKKQWVLIILLLIIGTVVYRYGTSVISAKIDHKIEIAGLTQNEKAALGPIPGDISLYAKELACSQALATPGYYSGLNAAEISDAQRSGMFPCANFTGSFTEPNQVFAWKSPAIYKGISYINNKEPGELYLIGGEYPTMQDASPVGPYLSKVDGVTGEEIWRTYLDNPNVSGRWVGNSNLNILENGTIPVAWSNQIALIDSETGKVLATNSIPTGKAPIENANFKHLTVAPDGTLILKDQTKPLGCEGQGTIVILKCAMEGKKFPASELVAIDPVTLEIIDHISLPDVSVSPHVITEFQGKIAIYIGMTESITRAWWNSETRKLTLDNEWTARPMAEGQGATTAPTILGDWVLFQLNGIGSGIKASSVVAFNQGDVSKHSVIYPFGELKKGEWSWAPPKLGSDVDNNMIFSADVGIGKVAGLKFDRETGNFETTYVLDVRTSTFQPVIGDKDQRVLLLTNMKLKSSEEDIRLAMISENYKEQMRWYDASSGKLLAESDYFEPLTINSLTTPGYGGRVYFPSAVGESFYTLQVMPAQK